MSRPADPFRRGQLAAAALFCSLGFQYATWAARIPAVKTDLALSTAEVGVLLMAAGVGAALSFPLVAWLMRRLGSRRLALLSQLCLALCLPALAAAPDYHVALLVMCLDGVFVGCLNVAMNAQGAALEARFERTTMARLHATFSAGSLLAALVASATTALTESVPAHFAVAVALLLALGVIARTGLLPDAAPAAPVAGQPRRRWTVPTALTLWMCCAMVFGTVAEGAMNDWSALYLKDVAEASAQLAPLGIAVVSGAMVIARLFADGWRDRFGDRRIVLSGSVLAAVALACALLVGGVLPALLGFACVGLGIAAVTPCVYAAAARQGSDSLTLVAAMGTTGLLAGPPVIGFIADASSLAWGMGAVAGSAAVVALCGTRITWEPAVPVAPAGPVTPAEPPRVP